MQSKSSYFYRTKAQGNIVFGSSLCTTAPETLSTHNKSVFGNLLLCSFDTDKRQVLNLKGKKPAAIVVELPRHKPPGLLVLSSSRSLLEKGKGE